MTREKKTGGYVDVDAHVVSRLGGLPKSFGRAVAEQCQTGEEVLDSFAER
jgi:hypothetical protein